jgi:hypothetical protein
VRSSAAPSQIFKSEGCTCLLWRKSRSPSKKMRRHEKRM